MIKNKKNNKGFTLVELLVVIAIIGILAVVAVPALFSNINKAKISDLEADYSAFKSASLAYYSDSNDLTGVTTGSLTDYMESVPSNSPFGTAYTLSYASSELTLSFDAPSSGLSAKEITKLKTDLGNDVVSVKITEDGSVAGSEKITLTVTKTNK